MDNEYEILLKKLLADILPKAKVVAEQAVSDASPVAAVVANPAIDMLDVYIMKLIGTPISQETEADAAPVTLDSLAQHVAALTVATGHGTSASMPIAKASVFATATPVASPTSNTPIVYDQETRKVIA